MKIMIYYIQISRAPKVEHRSAHARMQADLCLTLGIGRMPYSEKQRSGIELRTARGEVQGREAAKRNRATHGERRSAGVRSSEAESSYAR